MSISVAIVEGAQAFRGSLACRINYCSRLACDAARPSQINDKHRDKLSAAICGLVLFDIEMPGFPGLEFPAPPRCSAPDSNPDAYYRGEIEHDTWWSIRTSQRAMKPSSPTLFPPTSDI
jgi:hypothetical protein